VLVKPPCSVSTRDAYADVACRQESPVDLREILQKPVGQWRGVVTNDFEHSVFPRYPLIGVIKDTLYDMHALYASMSGSGSAVFGIFDHQPYSDLGAVFKDCFVFQSRLI
jgi:4-diphosphocytidyl-2-C-methyl-D-erythritol kinase